MTKSRLSMSSKAVKGRGGSSAFAARASASVRYSVYHMS